MSGIREISNLRLPILRNLFAPRCELDLSDANNLLKNLDSTPANQRTNQRTNQPTTQPTMSEAPNIYEECVALFPDEGDQSSLLQCISDGNQKVSTAEQKLVGHWHRNPFSLTSCAFLLLLLF